MVERLHHARGPAFFAQSHHGFAAAPARAVRDFDEQLVRSTLALVEEQRNEEARLGRLWLAVRALSARSLLGERDPAVLRYWNRVLGAWASSASWYGLHAHLQLGVLAALDSMRTVRARLRQAMCSDDADLAEPAGALASALYSVAMLAGRGRTRRRLLGQALEQANAAHAHHAADAGALSIRGAIQLRFGDTAASVADYLESVALRRAAGADAGDMGVGLSNLGFAYVRDWQPWKGLALMEEGVALLQSAPGVRAGFLARAKRKLATGYFVTGRVAKGRREMREARALARAGGAYDQVR